MHDHPGRLVDYDQVRILEANVERDRLRLRLGGFGFRQEHGDGRAGVGALRRVAQHLAAIWAAALDAPVEDQLLQAAARQLRQKALQGAIQPATGILGGDPDLDPLSAALPAIGRAWGIRSRAHGGPPKTAELTRCAR